MGKGALHRVKPCENLYDGCLMLRRGGGEECRDLGVPRRGVAAPDRGFLLLHHPGLCWRRGGRLADATASDAAASDDRRVAPVREHVDPTLRVVR